MFLVPYVKYFDEWNTKKKEVDGRNDRILYHEREVWWCYFGVNVGVEQDGKGKQFLRPVLVIKEFNQDAFCGIPLIGKYKQSKYHFPLGVVGNREASGILSQIRLMDTKRLKYKFAILNEPLFERLKKAIRDNLFS